MELGEGYKQMMTDENREKFEKANPEKSSYTVTYGDQTWNYSAKDMEMLSSAYAKKLKNDSDFAQKAFNSYTDSDFDRFAYEHKLPSWKTWSTVQEYAQKYNASGSLADNYGGVSDDQWKKINELWAKDWEYGLTDADLARKAAGLAPVSYDSMYEDTLLDDELKAAGLPPSKLLNGKLGDKYNEWIDNSEKYNDLMTEVVREYASKTKDREEVLKNAKTAYAAMGREDEPVISEYTMTNALMSVLSRPEWSEYGTAHYGKTSVLPDKSDEKYVAKDEYGYPLYDDNGSKIYDETAWMNDYMKALTANEKLNADEFSITLEKAQEWYDAHYADVKAYDDAVKAIKTTGINPMTATGEQLETLSDVYTGMQAQPFTVEQLFPDATPEQAKMLQPYADKVNNIMKTQGVTAAQNYLQSSEFQKDLHTVAEQDIVAAFRQQFPESKKTDDQIKDDYYNGIATSYGMNAEQSAQFREGTLTVSQFMDEMISTDSTAYAFAHNRKVRELSAKGMPTTKESIEGKIRELESSGRPTFTDVHSGKQIQGGLKGEDNKDEIELLKIELNQYDRDVEQYYTEALQHTDSFKSASVDSAEVSQKFDNVSRDAFSTTYRNGDKTIDNKRWNLVRDNATEEEKAVAVYLAEHPESNYGSYAELNKTGADEYIKQLGVKYSNEQTETRKRQWATAYNMANEKSGVFGATLAAAAANANILLNPVESGYNFAKQTIDKWVFGKELYSNDMLTTTSDLFGAIAGEIEQQNGSTLSTAYQMIPSFTQSAGGAVAAYFTGGATEAITLAAMGMQSYSSTAQEALQKGASSEEAWTLGLASGVAEVLFEKVSLDKFVKDINVVTLAREAAIKAGETSSKKIYAQMAWNMLKHAGTQGFVEASEEGATSIANLLTEQLILGFDSEYEKNKQRYLDAGMSLDEARIKAGEEVVNSVKRDMVLGFISGALMAFGGDIIQVGGNPIIDPTGTKRFLSSVHNLSAISTDEAMEVANKVAIRDANGELTVDGAKRVVSEVLKKGADAATLSRVENEMTTEDTMSPVRDVFATAINDTKIANAKTLAEAALRVAARSGVVENGTAKAGELTKEINEVARTYLNQMSETLQTADKTTLQQTISDMQRGFIDQIAVKAGYTHAAGMRVVAAQMASIPEAELQAGAEPVMVKLKQAGMTDATKSAFYANTAYTLMRSASDSRFTTALSSVFGKGASNVSSMIQNACLNSCSEDTVGFLDNVIEAIGMYETSDDASLARTLGTNMNDAAYIASMMAIARGRKAGSNSRVMYEYIVNNGASKATLDALAAVTYYDNMPSSTRKAMDKYVIEHDDAMMIADKREAVSEQQAKAQQNVESKQALVEAQEKHNAQTLEAAESIVQRHQAASDAVRSTETVVDPSGRVFRTTSADLAEVAASYAAALSDAINARDNLAQANARRLEGANADLDSAEQTFSTARKQFRTAMNRHSAAYVNMIGSQLEVIRGGGDVSLSEFDRITTLAANGTAEDLNSIKAKIIASEKRQAVCLGNEIGADVEIVKFTEQWFAEHGQKNGDVTKPACVIDGKMYLNESVWESRVGYGTDNVIWHEFSHIAQISGKNFNEFARLAYDFMCGKYGKESVDAFEKANGRAELAAEFARQELMTDPRAVKALCSNAPIMATRLYQWLSRISARHNNTIPQMQSIVNAQRMFAKTLKAATSDSKGNANVTVVERTNEAFNARNEVEEINTENRTEQEDVEVATAEAEERETAEEARYEIDRQENEETEPEPTAETLVEEQAAETAETAQEEPAEQREPVTLPFEIPESASKIISTIVQNKQRNAIDGRVSPATNDEIRRIAKYQINKAAQAAGVSVDADTLNAYVEQFTLPEFETSGESWINGYKSTETKPTAGSSFAELYNSTARGDAEYYTEFKPVNDAINRLSASDRARLGNPRLVEGKSGMMVAQNVSADGFANGIVTASGDRNIATLARADMFTDGTNAFMYKRVGISDLAAAVIPNGREYAELRTAARKNGVNVVTYDASEPSQFENAVNLAARSDSVQYYTDFEKWIQQYGAQKPGSQPRIEGRPVPKRTAANNRVSQTARTIAESPFTSNEQYIDQQGYIANGSGVYRPVSNAKTMSKARADIDRMGGAVNALNKLSMDVASGSGKSTDLLAIAESLYMDPQAMMAFTPSQREQLYTNICLVAEDAGRGLQLVGELKRMSPQGHQFFMEQEGKRQAARYQKRTGMMIDLTLTEEERQAYANAKTPEEVEAIDAAVTERWGKLTDHLTIGEKVRNWRYLSMLGNARTHFRNMVGNALMYPVVRVKDTINAGYQRLFGVAQEDRTTTAFTKALDAQTRTYVEEALQEALPIMQGVSSKYLETASKNANTSDAGEGKLRRLLSEAFTDVASTHVTEGRTAFGRGLNKFASLNSNLLEIEDAVSLGLRFRSSFAQQIQAKGLNVANITQAQRQQMMNYAMEESLRATFRDANTIADALNQFEKSHKVAGFFMESIVPFKKTPLNIVRRSVEYSPIGLVQGAYKMISNSASYKSQINSINAMNISESEKQARLRQAEASYKADRIAAIDRLSAGTTGTILTALGFFAASMGWITIGRKDDDSASFETALGRNAYSLNIGDVSIDLSAFAPAAVPLLMGTALYEASHASEKDQSFTSEMIEVLCETLDPITEMSMLSGIADSLNGISYSRQDDGAKTQYLSTIGLNAAKSYVGQFIPTFAGQLARVTDPYTRSYSAGSEYFASKITGPEVGSAVKNLQNKIPLVAWLSEPKVDLHGDKIENYTNWGAGVLHVLNNLVLPATIKVDRKNEIDDEMVRLYGVTDGSDMFPEKPSRSLGSYTDRRTGDTTPIKLQNDAEYTQYQMEYGQMVYDALEDLMRSGSYSRMTDDQKAEAIASVVKKTKEQVRSLWKAKKIKEMQ